MLISELLYARSGKGLVGWAGTEGAEGGGRGVYRHLSLVSWQSVFLSKLIFGIMRRDTSALWGMGLDMGSVRARGKTILPFCVRDN